MRRLTGFKVFTLIVICYLTHAVSLFGVAQPVSNGNVIYLRNQAGNREVIDFTTGQATALNQNDCIRFSTHFDVLASYRLENPEQLTFTGLATGASIAQLPWRSEWGNRLNNPAFCSAANRWLDNTTFRLPGIESSNQYYDVNVATGEVTGPVTDDSTPPELPLIDPRVSELGLGVDATLSPSGDQAIYSQCVESECDQNRYVLYDVRQQQVLAELNPPDFGFYYARRVPGNTVFSWSHDEQYIAISSSNAVLAVYDNVRNGWIDLSFLPPSFREIIRTNGGWNWSPDNTQIAFGAQQLIAMGYPFDFGIMTINLVSRTYHAFELNDDYIMNIVWLPSGDGLLIAFADGELYRLNFSDESLQFVDDHVSSLFAWYPPTIVSPTLTPTSISSETTTYTPSPTATDTPTATFTPTETPTNTLTPTATPTETPSVACTAIVSADDTAGLISAINTANSSPSTTDTLCLTSGSTYTVSSAVGSGNGLPAITSPITIVGNAATIQRSSGAPSFRLFLVAASGNLTLQNLTISGGSVSGDGGAIH